MSCLRALIYWTTALAAWLGSHRIDLNAFDNGQVPHEDSMSGCVYQEFRQAQSIKRGKRASFDSLTQTTTDNRDIQFGGKLVF